MGAHPSCNSTRAPIACRGSAIRSMGRFRSDASPVSTLPKRCPAMMPESRRIVVPELPQFNGSSGGRSPSSPFPSISSTPSSFRSAVLPRARTQSSVDCGSAEVGKLWMRDVPSPRAESRADRCEIDLSAGSDTVPVRLSAWRMVCIMGIAVRENVVVSLHHKNQRRQDRTTCAACEQGKEASRGPVFSPSLLLYHNGVSSVEDIGNVSVTDRRSDCFCSYGRKA